MSKAYTVILKETVQKQLKRLPAAYFKKVKGKEFFPGMLLIRFGVYRIIYSVQDDILTVYIFDIYHRKQVYR